MMFLDKKKFFIFPLLLLLIFFLFFNLSKNHSNELAVHIIDVNQGDSILIITPNNKTILIDGGDPTQDRNVITYLKKHQVKKIDLLLATHAHADHIGGLIDVIDYFPIGEFYLSPKPHTTKTFEKLLITAKKNQVKMLPVKENITLHFDNNIQLDLIAPIQDYEDHLNLWSIILKLTYHKKTFLFTGDMEYQLEIDLLQHLGEDFFQSNMLKVAHHGSNTSTSSPFLDAVNPEIAVISCGKENPYGYPHKEVIERLTAKNIQVYRTDLQGTVVLKSDGVRIWSHQKPYFSRSS